MSGQIVDASLVAAPKQRNTDDEKKVEIKAKPQFPDVWKAQAGQAAPEGSRRPLDGQFVEGKGSGRTEGPSTPVDIANPDLRLPEPGLDRPRLRLHPQMASDDASAYEGARLREAARQGQDQDERLGRTAHGPRPMRRGWRRTASSAESTVRSRRAGRCLRRRGAPMRWKLRGPLPGRARLRAAEGPDGPVHPNNRHRPGDHQDRQGQSRLQYQTSGCSGANDQQKRKPKPRACSSIV